MLNPIIFAVPVFLAMMAIEFAVDLLYQFWVHTRLVGKLGWFDRVFCSPSNHRVHHGQNDYCIDRNYGGLLIVWDRLFGTFVEERDNEPIVYGIRGALRSFNPVWANAYGYAAMWRDIRLTRTLADKLRVLFKHPGWRPADAAAALPLPAFEISRFERSAPPLSLALALNALLQLAVLIALALHFLAVAPQLGAALAAAYAAALIVQLAGLSRLTERGRDAAGWEAARWALGGALLMLSPVHSWGWSALWVVAGAAAAWTGLTARKSRFGEAGAAGQVGAPAGGQRLAGGGVQVADQEVSALHSPPGR